MLKRTIGEKDKFFVEIVVSIFRHGGDGLVEAGVFGSLDNEDISLPSDYVKMGELPEECLDNILKRLICDDYKNKLMSVMSTLKFIDSSNDHISVSYRVDIPRAENVPTKLSWLNLEDLVELNTNNTDVISDSHRKTLVGCL